MFLEKGYPLEAKTSRPWDRYGFAPPKVWGVACIVCALTLWIYTSISIDDHDSHVIKRLCDEG